MIMCKICHKEKNLNQYYATGNTMNKVCKTCLNTITQSYDKAHRGRTSL